MNEPTESPSLRGAGVAAFAVVFAVSSIVVELLATLGMRALDVEGVHLDPTGVRSGALLRLPLALALGALLGTTSGAEKRPTRFLLPALLSGPWIFFDVLAYRTLTATARLPRFSMLLSARELFRGPHVTPAIACAAGVALAALVVSPLLVRFFERRFSRKGIALADSLSVAFASLLSIAAIVLGSDSVYAGVVPTSFHFLRATPRTDGSSTSARSTEDPAPTDGIAYPPRDLRGLVYALTGVERPMPLADPSRPFCRAIEPTAASRKRSVILLVLHGAGSRELGAVGPDGPTMPNLARIAADGVSFTKFFAASNDPTEGLVSLLGGVQVFAPERYATLAVPPRLPAIASDLGKLGFGTYFVHAADPGVGRIRTLVRSVGFATVDAPGASLESATRTDRASVARIEDVITRHRTADSRKPYFLAATLLGAGEPLTGEDAWSRFAEATHDADAALGAFYAWYLEHEAPKGTVLVVSSDHASSLAPAGDVRNATSPTSARFEVPLVIAGLPAAELAEARTAKDRLGAHVDVAQTILGLFGLPPFGCYEGRDLLSQGGQFPEHRVVLSRLATSDVATVANDAERRWEILPAAEGVTVRVFERARDPNLANDVVAANGARVEQMKELALSSIAMGRYLATHDRFVLGVSASAAARPAPARPVRVAALGDEDAAYDVLDVANAGAAGFDAVRVRVGFDDGGPVLLDDPGHALGDVLARSGTLRVVLALGSAPANALDRARAVRSLTTLLAAVDRDRVVVTTVDVELALSLAGALPQPVLLSNGRDVPLESLVEAAARHGLAGISVHGAGGDDVVSAAHARGLVVLVETSSAPGATAPDFRVSKERAP